MRKCKSKFILIFCFVLIKLSSYSQENQAADTVTYKFKLVLNDVVPDLSCDGISIGATLEYSVLESNYKNPLHLVAIYHACPKAPLFKKGRTYFVEATVDFKNKHYHYGIGSTRSEMPSLICKKFQPVFGQVSTTVTKVE